jgi:hypothetical protein
MDGKKRGTESTPGTQEEITVWKRSFNENVGVNLKT